MSIEIPDTIRGKHIVLIDGIWHALYYRDGKPKRRSLRCKANERHAIKLRDKFYENLLLEGATVRQKRSPEDKLSDKPDLYIYRRKPFTVIVKGVRVAECDTKKEARAARDAYLAKKC